MKKHAISKNTARIIRHAIERGKHTAQHYGTSQGIPNGFQFWSYNVRNWELSLSLESYFRAYSKALNEKLSGLSDEQIKALDEGDQVARLTPEQQENYYLRKKLAKLESAQR